MEQSRCAGDQFLRRGVAGGRKVHRAEAGNGVLVLRVIFLCRREYSVENQWPESHPSSWKGVSPPSVCPVRPPQPASLLECACRHFSPNSSILTGVVAVTEPANYAIKIAVQQGSERVERSLDYSVTAQ